MRFERRRCGLGFSVHGFRQEEKEHQERRERDSTEAEERDAKAGGEVDEVSAIGVAERSTGANGGSQRTRGEIEASGAAGAIGDDQHRDDPEDGVREAI